jgi:hypothetical protein
MGMGQKPKTQEEIMQKTAEYAARKLSAKKRTPSSTELNCTATNAEVVEMVQKAYILFDRPHAVTDDDVCESFNWYFSEYLPKTGAFPTIEGLSLACGVDRRTLEDWKNGHLSPTRSAIVQKGIGILAELDAQLVQSGKIPQVVYIFRSKNFYGLQDAVKVEHVTTRPDAETPDQIAQKVADAIPADFTVLDDAES